MRLTIEGREREAEIIPVPRGTFYVEDGCAYPVFPLFCAVCKPLPEEDFAELLTFAGEGIMGIAILRRVELKSEVSDRDLAKLLKVATEFCDGDKELAMENIVNQFLRHGTPFDESAQAYVEDEVEVIFDPHKNNRLKW